MKRKTAKELLAESFREVAAEKDINKITVRDVVENCGYSTATFYRHFKDKYDLIAWDYARDIEKILEQFDGTKVSWRQALKDAADYYSVQKDYLENLLLHTTGYDSFFGYMIEINNDCLNKRLRSGIVTEKSEVKTEMLIRGYCIETVSLTCEWILGKYAVSAAELVDIYEEAMPDLLHKYLY